MVVVMFQLVLTKDVVLVSTFIVAEKMTFVVTEKGKLNELY